MKHFFTLLTLLTGLQSITTAQITITAADMPVQNETFYFIPADSVWTAGIDISAGMNKTWDLSGAVESAVYPPFAEAWIAPSGSIFAGDFPTATIASIDPSVVDSSDANFYLFNNNTLSILGIGSVDGNSTYTPAQQVMKYPLTFGTSFSSISDIETSALEMPVSGTSTVSADVNGWGTLKTPLGSFAVLRVERNTELAFTIFGFPVTANVESVEFIGKEYGRALFTYEKTTTSFFGETSVELTSGWLSDATVSANAPAAEINTFDLSPNPATDQVNLSLALQSSNRVKACIFSTTGQLMSVTNISAGAQIQQMPLDVAALPTGHYTVVLLGTNGKVWGSKQLVKE